MENMENAEKLNQPLESYSGYSNLEIQVITKNCTGSGKTKLNNEEVVQFCKIAKTYQLDPFTKEIWGMKMKGGVMIEASASGWRKIIRRQKQFKRMILNAYYEEDEIQFDNLSGAVLKHTSSGNPKGSPLGAYCMVEYLDGTSNLSIALWSEYGKSKTLKSQYGEYETPWKYAQEMIKNKASAIFGRTYCGVSGLYAKGEVEEQTIEEANDEYENILIEMENCKNKEELQELSAKINREKKFKSKEIQEIGKKYVKCLANLNTITLEKNDESKENVATS